MNEKRNIVVVGGAGHVGLPLSLLFAEQGYKVAILDPNTAALAKIAAGKFPFLETGGEELLGRVLKSGNLELTSDAACIAKADVIVVTIGTPVDEFLNPVLRMVRDCIASFQPHLRDDQLVILRSTLFPGTTELLQRDLQAAGKNALLSFCPERVVQGKAIEEIRKFPQIISGTSPLATRKAAEVFLEIAPSVVELSPTEAEFAKLFTNAYRYIEFAASNQFYSIAKAAGLSYPRILEALRFDYPRARQIPSAGMAAGPCLLKDTMQLAAYAENLFNIGNTAMMINEGFVHFLINKLKMNFAPLESKTIGLLGMAFKADNDDTRSSLSYKLKKFLNICAGEVLTADPFVTCDPALLPPEEVIRRSDVLVLCVPHTCYRDLDFKGKPVVDSWGYLPGSFEHPRVIQAGDTSA